MAPDPVARTPNDTALAELVKLDKLLWEKRPTVEHSHGGPNPCPACGGTKL